MNGLLNDIITVTGTSFRTGQKIRGTGGVDGQGTLVNTGLAYSTAYYVFKITDTSFKLCNTYAHSIAGTNFLSLTDTEDMSAYTFKPYDFFFDSISSNKLEATEG